MAVNPAAFRAVLARVPTAVSIITTVNASGEPQNQWDERAGWASEARLSGLPHNAGRALPRPVTILLPLTHRASPTQRKLVFVFAKETATGRWRPLRTTVVRDGTYASVTVRRLSWFSDFTVDPGQVLAELKNFFRELTNGAFSNASLLSCDRSSAAQSDGYTYATDGTAMLARCRVSARWQQSTCA
jgi:hypothetical protein